MESQKMFVLSVFIGIFIILGFSINTSNACTGIRLISDDGSVVYGRTMEWGAFDMQARIAIFPRGFSITGTTPDGLNGKKYNAKFGYVGIDMIKKNFLNDGMNEVGLAVGAFYHDGFETYQDYKKEYADNSIAPQEMVNYILSNFATIEEVKYQLHEVRVVAVVDPSIKKPVYMHWMVTEPQGESIVIEYTDGKLTIHNAPLGVITNDPSYDWHMTNLRNYININEDPAFSKTMGGVTFAPLGVGSGMLGLPGDFTPPSRFVRAVTWTQTARPTPISSETVYEIFRILDNFNVPLFKGEALGTKGFAKGLRSSTEWTSAWDLSKKVLYYHTQNNRRVRAIDLKNIDFSNIGDQIVHLPLDKVAEQDIEYITL